MQATKEDKPVIDIAKLKESKNKNERFQAEKKGALLLHLSRYW
jgi:hypothetical protein